MSKLNDYNGDYYESALVDFLENEFWKYHYILKNCI